MSRANRLNNRVSMSWSSKLFSRLVPGFSQRKRPMEQDPCHELPPEPALKFHIGMLDDVEDRELYRPGGFHPTRIGDVLNGTRFKILHKLGYGGFATVWFARDRQTESNVAIKITAADTVRDGKELEIFDFISNHHSSASGEPNKTHIPTLLDHFWLEGPNGRHLCLVMPVLGPSIQQVIKTSETKRLSAKTARSASLQAAQALASLHSIGLGHGDFRPGNLLFALGGISQWSDEEVKERLGEVIEETVLYRDGRPVRDPSVPPTVISPLDYTALIPKYLERTIHLVDLGEAFHLNAPPAEGLGTPASYRAPESHFEHAASTQTDIWALACTIFEIRAGYALFETFVGEYEDEVAKQVVTALGKMPEPWWSKWTFRDAFFDQDGQPVEDGMPARVTLEENIKEIGRDDSENDVSGKTEGILCQEEVADLADLLGKMLKYEPSERIDIQEVLRHQWFEKDYEASESS